MEKSIVQVVFDFDPDTFQPRENAKPYTYFSTVAVKEGDLAVVFSPMSRGLACVIVVNTEPSASAIRRATKALIGVVNTGKPVMTAAEDREQAFKEAWDRFEAPAAEPPRFLVFGV